MAYVESLSESERNKIISRSAVQSTVHFQKRVEKIFQLIKYDDIFEGLRVEDFYYRIEFQGKQHKLSVSTILVATNFAFLSLFLL